MIANATSFTCDDCGHIKPVQKEGGTGYAITNDGKHVCYECCATRDRKAMRETGKATLYLVRSPNGGHEVTNWPGSLRLRVGMVKRGKHNIARVRYDFWFSFEGHLWHGYQIGDNTQLATCKRTKEAA
jgi:hypothetical protein